MPSRVRLLISLVLAGLAAVACEVSTEVGIVVDDDGSGEVTVTARLDGEAAARLGDPAAALALEDLADGGWSVRGPESPQGGGIEVAATKPFGSPDGLQAVLGEVAGGVFSGFAVELTPGLGSRTWDLTGEVRLAGGLEQFGDDDLTAALDGLPLGRTPEELSAELAEGSFPVVLSVRLPEPVDDAADTTGTAERFPAREVSWSWSVSGEPVDESIRATASRRELGGLRWVAMGVVALLLVAVVWVVSRLRAGGPSPRPPRETVGGAA